MYNQDSKDNSKRSYNNDRKPNRGSNDRRSSNGFNRNSDDRPKRDGDRPRRDGDRPNRGGFNRDRNGGGFNRDRNGGGFNRDRNGGGFNRDRGPRRDFNDRPRRDGDRPQRDGDRPRRDFNDRPRRDGDRPNRGGFNRDRNGGGFNRGRNGGGFNRDRNGGGFNRDRGPRRDFGDRPRRNFDNREKDNDDSVSIIEDSKPKRTNYERNKNYTKRDGGRSFGKDDDRRRGNSFHKNNEYGRNRSALRNVLKEVQDGVDDIDVDILDIDEDGRNSRLDEPERIFWTRAYVEGAFEPDESSYSFGLVIQKDDNPVQINGRYSDENNKLHAIPGEVLAASKAMEFAYKNEIKNLEIHFNQRGVAAWPLKEWETNLELSKKYAEFFNNIKDKVEIRFVKNGARNMTRWNQLAKDLAYKATFDNPIDTSKEDVAPTIDLDENKETD